jgi:hypothetical protein
LKAKIPESTEYNQVAVALHRELGLRPWDVFVTDVYVVSVPPPNLAMRVASFKRAVSLRSLLIQAT